MLELENITYSITQICYVFVLHLPGLWQTIARSYTHPRETVHHPFDCGLVGKVEHHRRCTTKDQLILYIYNASVHRPMSHKSIICNRFCVTEAEVHCKCSDYRRHAALLLLAMKTSSPVFCSRYRLENTARISLNIHFPWRPSV